MKQAEACPKKDETGRQVVRGREGFTLVELLVVIGIIAVLIAILLPVLGNAREQANTVKCLSNMRQLGISFMTYAAENRGRLCPCDCQDGTGAIGGVTDYWSTILVSSGYLPYPPADSSGPPGGEPVFTCPSGIYEKKSSDPATRQDSAGACGQTQSSKILQPGLVIFNWYGVNATTTGYVWSPLRRVPSDNKSAGTDTEVVTAPDPITRVKNSSETVLLYDGVNLNMINTDANRLNARHKKRTVTNLTFFDGHAESFKTADLPGGLGDANPAKTTFGVENLKKYPYPKWRLDQ